MARANDLTTEAALGFANAGNPCPYLFSSASWFAWQVGEWLKRTGRSAPRDVRMGRGYQVHVNDMLVAFDAHNAITRIK